MSKLLEDAARLDPQRAADLMDDEARLKAEADVARDGPGKGERLARLNDQYAMDLQIQFQGFIGGLPV